ncbi:MAG: hypothetical protein ACLTSX_00150 [Collinsella sp.]
MTIRSRINRLEELRHEVADGSMALRGKKEQAVLGKGARQVAGQPRWRP